MNSKKLTVILSLVALTTFLLGACAPAAIPVTVATSVPIVESELTAEVSAQAAPVSAPAAVELNAAYENAVSIEEQSILGIFKLEGTDLAVSKEQASVLIPLYSNLKTITESTMPAQGTQPQTVSAETQAQIDSIIKNILAAMTPEQVKAISEMQITREIAQTIMTEKGISMGGRGQGGGKPNGANDQPPEGTPPAGGGGGTSQGDAVQNPGSGMIQPELINILLELLQSK